MYCKYMYTEPTSTRRTHLPERLLPPFVVAEGGHDLNVGAVRLEPVEQQLALLALLHYPPGEGDNIPLMSKTKKAGTYFGNLGIFIFIYTKNTKNDFSPVVWL